MYIVYIYKYILMYTRIYFVAERKIMYTIAKNKQCFFRKSLAPISK